MSPRKCTLWSLGRHAGGQHANMKRKWAREHYGPIDCPHSLRHVAYYFQKRFTSHEFLKNFRDVDRNVASPADAPQKTWRQLRLRDVAAPRRQPACNMPPGREAKINSICSQLACGEDNISATLQSSVNRPFSSTSGQTD